MVSLPEAIELLIARGPALRAAGVLTIHTDGFAVKLAAHVEQSDVTPAGKSGGDAENAEDKRPPLSDPTTYGGRIPGYVMDDDEGK